MAGIIHIKKFPYLFMYESGNPILHLPRLGTGKVKSWAVYKSDSSQLQDWGVYYVSAIIETQCGVFLTEHQVMTNLGNMHGYSICFPCYAASSPYVRSLVKAIAKSKISG